MSHPVILFDGVCKLCDSSIHFFIDRDPKKKLRFATLQSSYGQKILKQHALPQEKFTSMLLLEGKQLHTKSDAVLRALKYTQVPWSWLSHLRLVPRFLRNAVYDLIAKRRYRWFGKFNQCRVPTPDLRERFIDFD
jgi:predicted DCC family thiol-disulfide oxidoreductase YuxK